MTAFVTGTDVDTGPAPVDSLLKFALRADATLCAAVGLLVAVAADPVARLTGLTATAGWLTGASLVGYGALLFALVGLADVRKVGIGVIVGNIAFGIVTVTVLLTGWWSLTGTGTELLLCFVVATAVLAWLQYRGVRRLV